MHLEAGRLCLYHLLGSPGGTGYHPATLLPSACTRATLLGGWAHLLYAISLYWRSLAWRDCYLLLSCLYHVYHSHCRNIPPLSHSSLLTSLLPGENFTTGLLEFLLQGYLPAFLLPGLHCYSLTILWDHSFSGISGWGSAISACSWDFLWDRFLSPYNIYILLLYIPGTDCCYI